MINRATAEQVLPKGKGVDVAELVKADIESRIQMGAQKYGERLTTLNGRDALWDAYQEVLDLAVYLRQHLWEMENGHEGTASPPFHKYHPSGIAL